MARFNGAIENQPDIPAGAAGVLDWEPHTLFGDQHQPVVCFDIKVTTGHAGDEFDADRTVLSHGEIAQPRAAFAIGPAVFPSVSNRDWLPSKKVRGASGDVFGQRGVIQGMSPGRMGVPATVGVAQANARGRRNRMRGAFGLEPTEGTGRTRVTMRWQGREVQP